MIYQKEDFRLTKTARETHLAYCMIHGLGVFGNEVFAANVSFAIQQVYDRYEAYVRLTKEEYNAFPGNLDALRPLMEDSSRILLTYGDMGKDITAFDSDLLGPAPLGKVKKTEQ